MFGIGEKPYPDEVIEEIIATAQDHFLEMPATAHPSVTHRYETTFANLLSQLKNANQTAASQDFASLISNGMLSYLAPTQIAHLSMPP